MKNPILIRVEQASWWFYAIRVAVLRRNIVSGRSFWEDTAVSWVVSVTVCSELSLQCAPASGLVCCVPWLREETRCVAQEVERVEIKTTDFLCNWLSVVPERPVAYRPDLYSRLLPVVQSIHSKPLASADLLNKWWERAWLSFSFLNVNTASFSGNFVSCQIMA